MLDPNVNESILLYRYLRADAALKTIKSRLLRVGRISELNDPFEWRLGVTGIIPQGESIAHGCMQQVIDGLHAWMGILCFSDTSMEPVLWSHYPEKHHGVAFEFDYKIDPERLFKMSYSTEIARMGVRA